MSRIPATPPLVEQVLDVLRWAHLTGLVPLVPGSRPRAMRLLRSAITPMYRNSFGLRHTPALRTEIDRCRGGEFDTADPDEIVRDTYRMWVRVTLEEAALPRLGRDGMARVCRVQGREHIDAALARGNGALMAFLHFGQHWYLPVWCGYNGYTWNQVAAAGRPPVETWNPNWFGRQVFDKRDAWFAALPVNFLPLDTPHRVLVRALARNELVGIAVDGRVGTRFQEVRFLGREARFSPGAIKLSRITGAPIIPCNTVVAADGRQQVTFLPSMPAVGRKTDIDGAVQALVDALEPFVLEHAGHYGSWLHHVNHRRDWDDHPFFTDYDD